MMDWGANIDAVIASGGTTSGAIRTGPYRQQLNLQFATMTGTAMTFHGSDAEDGTFVEIVTDGGVAISITVTDDKVVYLNEEESRAILACPFIKLVSGSAEGGARTIGVFMK